jgi:aspartate 1-decarboxylase
MQLTLLKSKIHRATVTGASLHYEGSLTVSSDLAELIELREYEKILVGNLSNGERFETYVIYGEPRQGLIELNGATANLGKIGDRITIMNFGSYSAEEAARHQPRVLVLDEKIGSSDRKASSRRSKSSGNNPQTGGHRPPLQQWPRRSPLPRRSGFQRVFGANRTGSICASRDNRR